MFSSNARERSHSLKDVNRWWIDGEKGGFVAKFLLTNMTIKNGESIDRFIVEQNKGLFSHMNATIPQKLESFHPHYIIDMCLNKIYVEDLNDVEFSLSCNGLDHLANFERMRLFNLQTAASNLRINESNWRDVLAGHSAAKQWVESVIRRSFLIDVHYARVWTDLRIWTVAKKLESKPFNQAEAIAVLNTMFPPFIEIFPNQNITLESVANHRATFFNYLAVAGSNGPDSITGYIHGLNSPANERNWANVRKTLKEYLSLAGDLIKESEGIRDVRDLVNSERKLSFESSGIAEALAHNSTPRHKKSQPQMRDLVHATTPTDDRDRSVSFGDVTILNTPRSKKIPHTPVPLTPSAGNVPLKSSFARSSTSIESKSIVPPTPGLLSHSFFPSDQIGPLDKFSTTTGNGPEPHYTQGDGNWDGFMDKFGRREAYGKESRTNQSFDEASRSPIFTAGHGSSDSFGRIFNNQGPMAPLPPVPKVPSSPFAQGFRNDSNVFRSSSESITRATAASQDVHSGKSQQPTPALPNRSRVRPAIPTTSPGAIGAMNTGMVTNQPIRYVTKLDDPGFKTTNDPGFKAANDPPAKKKSSNIFSSFGKRHGDKEAEGDMSGELPSFDRYEGSLNGSPRSRKTLRKARSGVSLRSAGTEEDAGKGMFGKDRNFSKSAMSGEVMTGEDAVEPPSQVFKVPEKPASFLRRGKNSEGNDADGGKKKEKPLTDQLLSEVSVADTHDEYLRGLLLEQEREKRKRRMKGEMLPPPTPARDQSGLSDQQVAETPKASRLERVLKSFAGSYSPVG